MCFPASPVGFNMAQAGIFFFIGTSLKSSTPQGAVRISLRAKRLRARPESATSDRELAALQPPRTEPSSASVRRKTAVKTAAEEQTVTTTQNLILGENAAVSPVFTFALQTK